MHDKIVVLAPGPGLPLAMINFPNHLCSSLIHLCTILQTTNRLEIKELGCKSGLNLSVSNDSILYRSPRKIESIEEIKRKYNFLL